MPIFARRVLQRLLDTTDVLLTHEQSKERLRRLNAANEQSLDTEWEVALLYGLARLGAVRYEPKFGGTSNPDLHFNDGIVEFVADVVTVNDSGYEQANRRKEFEREFWLRIRRTGLPLAGFSYRINGEEQNGKMRLLLPDDWDALFETNFSNMLAWVKLVPSEPVALHRKEPGIDVIFSYTPKQDSLGGGYLAYRKSKRPTATPIYHALKRKRDQLKVSGYTGTRGIILCDGDCEELRAPEQIVRRFFRDTESVSFVVVITLSGSRFDRREKPIRITARVYQHPALAMPNIDALRLLFEQRLPSVIPSPYDDVVNALNHLRWKKRRAGLSHHGGYTFSGRHMKISSRALLELLSGEITSEEFMKVHRFTKDEPIPNPFAVAIRQGRMIADITVKRDENDDDDWIEFEFTDPDPAISNFRPPLRSTERSHEQR